MTMADIARTTGLSKMTVSRVLSNHPYVSPETRKKVEAAVRKLGFQPNILAKRFFTGKTQMLSVVAPVQFVFRSRYFENLLQGVFELTEEAGYDVIFHNSASPRWRPEEKCLQVVKGRLVEGLLIIAPMIYDDYPERLARAGIPVVVLGETVCGARVNRVLPPNRAMAAQMTRYLLERGHTRMALLTFDASHVESNEREAGFREAITKAGLAVENELILAVRYDRTAACEAVSALLKRRRDVTAIFALNMDMAFGACDAVKSHGLSIPRDISVVVFDDAPEIERWDPPLTAVRQDAFKIGYEGCHLLLDILAQSTRRSKPQTVVVPAEIIERASVDAAKGRSV